MEELLALGNRASSFALDAGIGPGPGRSAREHRRTHGQGPGHDQATMELIAAKRQYNRVLASRSSRDKPSDPMQEELNLVFKKVAKSQVSFSALAQWLDTDRRQIPELMTKYLRVLLYMQPRLVMNICKHGLRLSRAYHVGSVDE